MSYTRTRKIARMGNIHGGRGVRQDLGATVADLQACTDSCTQYDTDGTGTSDQFVACMDACNALPTSTTTTTSTPSTSSSGSSSSSSSSGSSSIWSGIGNLLGGIGKTLATPTPTVVQSGPDMTTILLIGGALVGVILLTKKRPAATSP